jgi:hypothetical protein
MNLAADEFRDQVRAVVKLGRQAGDPDAGEAVLSDDGGQFAGERAAGEDRQRACLATE